MGHIRGILNFVIRHFSTIRQNREWLDVDAEINVRKTTA